MRIRHAVSWEWDAIASIAADFVAIVLHLLHIDDETVVVPILLVIVSVLFMNFMRYWRNSELTAVQVERMAHTIDSLHAALVRPGLVPIGPPPVSCRPLITASYLRSAETPCGSTCSRRCTANPRVSMPRCSRPSTIGGRVDSVLAR